MNEKIIKSINSRRTQTHISYNLITGNKSFVFLPGKPINKNEEEKEEELKKWEFFMPWIELKKREFLMKMS